ncbi:MAG: phosphatidylglycerol lysyltransferase domain-containing protein, partial [Oscillospiraceae bacterium]|nr:phosphatidylglycerol lysyltransferase domain-containing protein [Oscillospiraceae bacterium]
MTINRFHRVTLCDKPWIDEIVKAEDSPSADYNFGNIYIWDKRYRQLVARCGDRMLTRLRIGGHVAYVFPIGTGPLRPALEFLRACAEARGCPLTLRGLTGKHVELLESEYPGRFDFEEDADNADYIYEAQSLASYAGKALHGKKNHCNRFEAENDWEFRPLTDDLIPGCLDMLDVWSEENSERLDKSVSYEHDAIVRAFAAYKWLVLEGGVLFANGKIVGFSLGEMCSNDTFDVHFEKAQIDLNGAYPMVCRELT